MSAADSAVEYELRDRQEPSLEPDFAELSGDGPEDAACPHPAAARRLEDGEQVCRACGQVMAPQDRQRIVPTDRPGTTDPTQREGDERSRGGLRHITWDPANPASSRPYTPEEVELELVDTLDRIERGAGWLTT